MVGGSKASEVLILRNLSVRVCQEHLKFNKLESFLNHPTTINKVGELPGSALKVKTIYTREYVLMAYPSVNWP